MNEYEMIMFFLEILIKKYKASTADFRLGDIINSTDPTNITSSNISYYTRYPLKNDGNPYLRFSNLIDGVEETDENPPVNGSPDGGVLKDIVGPLIYGDRYRHTFPYVTFPKDYFTNR